MLKLVNNLKIIRLITIAIVVVLLFSSVPSGLLMSPKPAIAQSSQGAIIVTVDGLSVANTFGDLFDEDSDDYDNYLGSALESMSLEELGISDSDIIPFTWSRDAEDTLSVVVTLEEELIRQSDNATSQGKKFIVVSHSWGTYLTYVALANLSTGEDPVIPDLYITLSSPLGSMWAHEGQPYYFEKQVIDYVVKWNIELAWRGYPHSHRHVNYWAWGDAISGPLGQMLPDVEDVQVDVPTEETEWYRNVQIPEASPQG